MKLFALALCVAVVNASASNAQNLTGNVIYEACTANDEAMSAFCSGYIIGQIEGKVFGALLFSNGLELKLETAAFNELANGLFHHCIPAEASNRQLQDVTVRYLQQNPGKRHESARFLVWEALMDAFPCQGQAE